MSFVAKVRPKVQTLLNSLTELSKLLYLPAHLQCPKLVLRLHNQAFIHAMICKEIIGQPKILTESNFMADIGVPLLCLLGSKAELSH